MVPAQINIFGGLLLSMSSDNIEYKIDWTVLLDSSKFCERKSLESRMNLYSSLQLRGTSVYGGLLIATQYHLRIVHFSSDILKLRPVPSQPPPKPYASPSITLIITNLFSILFPALFIDFNRRNPLIDPSMLRNLS